MLKKIFAILLILFLSGCSLNQFVKSDQIITKEAKNEEQEYLNIFLEDYDESEVDILEKYYFDFDNDKKNELVILFSDLKNMTYSNIAVVKNEFVQKYQLDADNKYRYIKPLESQLNGKEIQVILQNIDTQLKLKYYLTLDKTDEYDASFTVRSEITK